MTVVVSKGVLVTNLEAKPFVQGGGGQTGNGLKVAYVTEEVATNVIDTIDDTMLLLPLPAGARMIELHLFNDDLDGHATPTLAVDVGGYYGDDVLGKVSGQLIDADNIATAITTLQAANTVGVNILFEAQNINGIGKPLWQILGLTSNPGGTIIIGLRVTTVSATPAAGTITLVAKYL